MLIAIDIGNSLIKVGVFGNSLTVHRMAAQPVQSPAYYRKELERITGGEGMDKAPPGVVISSVVPGLSEAVGAAAREFTKKEPLFAGPEKAGGLRFDIKEPGALGPDRIASSVAAAALLGPPVAVVDFGSATTVNFVAPAGDVGLGVYEGGAILPGIGMMLGTLSRETARLPLVEPRDDFSVPGRDTEENILAGVIQGTAGAVENIVRRACGTGGREYRVAVTGGYMRYVLPFFAQVDLAEPDLVLRGLEMIYMRETGDA